MKRRRPFGLCCFQSASCPLSSPQWAVLITLAPYHLMGDLQRMEVAARGLDRELYGIGDIELKQYDNSRAQGFVTFMDLLFM